MNAFLFIGAKGGEVHFVNDADGEVLRSLPLVPGVHARATFEKLRRRGERAVYSVAPVLVQAQSAFIRHGGHYDSAANPSFRVSPAQRQAKQLQALMARSEALNRSAQKALQAVKRAKRDVPKIEHKPELLASDAGEVSSA